MQRYLTPIIAALLLAGCPADEDAAWFDAASETGPTGDRGQPDQTVVPWQPGLPDSARLETIRGLRVARGIIHAHSLHSHDACDNKPTFDGKPNEACLADMRRGLCTTRVDFLMLTEHITSLSLVPFEELLLLRGNDKAVLKGGAKVANSIHCPGSKQRPLMLVGAELDRTMPVGLTQHVEGAAAELKKIYGGKDTALDAKLKAAGAVLLQAHTESKPLTELLAHALDGIEVYNLHANLDPKIRKTLGLDPLGYLNDVAPFLAKEPTAPQPDLAFMAFFAESDNAINKWTRLLAQRPTSGVLGTDAHQNVLPLMMRDGERVDSYRRMFRWFSNHMRVKQVTFDAVKEAVKLGRGYMVFEVLGTPDGFDFHARAGAQTAEMGGTAALASKPLLRVTMPTVLDLAAGEQPKLEAQLIHVDAAGSSKVVAKGATGLVYNATAAGAYRVELRMLPTHLRRWLGPKPESYLKQRIWIYSNPIYVK